MKKIKNMTATEARENAERGERKRIVDEALKQYEDQKGRC